jgi:hypothetical protein
VEAVVGVGGAGGDDADDGGVDGVGGFCGGPGGAGSDEAVCLNVGVRGLQGSVLLEARSRGEADRWCFALWHSINLFNRKYGRYREVCKSYEKPIGNQNETIIFRPKIRLN